MLTDFYCFKNLISLLQCGILIIREIYYHKENSASSAKIGGRRLLYLSSLEVGDYFIYRVSNIFWGGNGIGDGSVSFIVVVLFLMFPFDVLE